MLSQYTLSHSVAQTSTQEGAEMRKRNSIIRRGAALVAMALGMLAISGSGASAVGAKLPEILNGQADATALQLSIDIPALEDIQKALADAGVDTTVVDLDMLGLPAINIRQNISLTQGQVLRSIDPSVNDLASGFAAVTQGDLLNEAVESACHGSVCGDNQQTAGTRVDLPLDLGYILLNGAESATTSLVDTRNNTKLAEVLVDLEPLLNGQLSAVGDLLDDLTDTINSTVIPAVNPVLEQVETTLRDVLPNGIENDIVDLIVDNIGPVEAIPSLRSVDLVDLTVLGARADVFPEVRGGVEGLLATSSSKITDLNILGDWATLGAVNLETSAYANGTKGQAVADAIVDIIDANLGGALGINITGAEFAKLTNAEYLYNAIRKDVGALPELESVFEELAAATKLLAQIAGINVTLFDEVERVDPNGNSAFAAARSVLIEVEPMVPNAAALTAALQEAIANGQAVPRLDEDDFVSTGIRVAVELPQSAASVSLGSVLGKTPPPPTTGVATPLLAGLMLLGGAITIRRFAIR